MKKVIVSLLVLAFVALAATGTVSAQCAAKATTTSVATTCAQCTSCQKTSACPATTCASCPTTVIDTVVFAGGRAKAPGDSPLYRGTGQEKDGRQWGRSGAGPAGSRTGMG